QRPEVRWCRKQDHVDGFDHALIGVEPGEATLLRHVDLPRRRFVALEQRQAPLQPVLKSVAHRDELHVGIRLQRLERGARAAPAASDEADAEQVRSGRVSAAPDPQTRGGGSGGECGGGITEKAAARGRWRRGRWGHVGLLEKAKRNYTGGARLSQRLIGPAP